MPTANATVQIYLVYCLTSTSSCPQASPKPSHSLYQLRHDAEQSCCTCWLLCSYHFPCWISSLDTELLKFNEKRILPDSILHSKFKLLVTSMSKILTVHTVPPAVYLTTHCFPSLPALTFLQSLTCATIQKSFFQMHTRLLNLQGLSVSCRLPSEGLLCYRGGICHYSVDTYRERVCSCIVHLCLFYGQQEA